MWKIKTQEARIIFRANNDENWGSTRKVKGLFEIKLPLPGLVRPLTHLHLGVLKEEILLERSAISLFPYDIRVD